MRPLQYSTMTSIRSNSIRAIARLKGVWRSSRRQLPQPPMVRGQACIAGAPRHTAVARMTITNSANGGSENRSSYLPSRMSAIPSSLNSLLRLPHLFCACYSHPIGTISSCSAPMFQDTLNIIYRHPASRLRISPDKTIAQQRGVYCEHRLQEAAQHSRKLAVTRIRAPHVNGPHLVKVAVACNGSTSPSP